MGRKRRESAADCTQTAHDWRGDEAIANMPLVWGGYIIRPTDAKHTDIREAPNESGIYAWYTKDCELMYVGRSNAICTRLRQHRERTTFWGGSPTYYSYRLVPERYISGVENAHIRALEPVENMHREGSSVAFGDELEATINAAWKDTLPAQRESLNRKYMDLAQQIAARIRRPPLTGIVSQGRR